MLALSLSQIEERFILGSSHSIFSGHVGIVEGASDFVDPPLSFDVLSGFVSRSDIVSDVSSMDLSIFEYLPVSCDIDLSAPSSPTSQIFDIDDEIAQHDSDDDSSSVSDSDPVDQRVSPADMPGLDPSIVQHRLPLLPHARPVKQKLRRLHPRWSLQVKEEIQKQLSVGFLSVVEYPEWLANVVPVPKKDGKVRVCVDFRDLNKASPKDDFPLPHIDMLVDSTAGHSMLSFMDGFSGYSQILMAPEDMEKTSFITEWGTYCYRVMPFGLKNAGATYQRAATTLFHDMMHRDVEVYVDDMIVKSRGRSDHLAALGERGIEVDPDKIRAILDMPAPRTERGQRLPGQTSVHQQIHCQIDRHLPALVGRLMRWLVLLTEFDIHYVTQKSIRGSIVADHLASLPVSDARAIDDDFPDEDVAAVTSLSGWRMYFDGAANHSGYGIGVLLISPHGDHIPRSVRLAFSDRHPATNNIVEYEACILGLETALELGIRQMEVFGDSNLSRSAPAYCCLIDDMEIDDGLPWYHDIYHFLRLGVYPEAATAKDRRALRQLATRFVICGETLYRRSLMGCYYVLTAPLPIELLPVRSEMSRVSDTRRSHSRAALELHALTSPWPFSVWGIDHREDFRNLPVVMSSSLVAIDYFTKWVEAASYARLTSSGVASFIRSHIICRYGVPHELISDRGVHFRAEVDTLVQRYASGIIDRLRATPYSLVYGMEAVLPVEIEMGSLRVALEQQIPETDWAQARFDQLNLLDERRLRAADHVRAYQRKMARAFKKRVKPRPLHVGSCPEGAAWLMDLDGNQFSEPTNVDQLKRYYV
ncbi:Transposon Ty3-G Gag-Pol polyprotein [Vitis vinifera]|uniref:Transposon Ty3-G Gag-Pol polyprotein n=1 Tax=Vitis vinifera TaxID=29760 RepID=A0A438FFV0_VITVI|nr:Transposon Ty3-G Gag-Pol polyprotein [Vitis vinifera]